MRRRSPEQSSPTGWFALQGLAFRPAWPSGSRCSSTAGLWLRLCG
nr:MAG TPA: hypothetical protein [Bacteriophage sp.]